MEQPQVEIMGAQTRRSTRTKHWRALSFLANAGGRKPVSACRFERPLQSDTCGRSGSISGVDKCLESAKSRHATKLPTVDVRHHCQPRAANWLPQWSSPG